MQVRLVFRYPDNYRRADTKVFYCCDNLLVKKELDSEVYDRAEDVTYYNFTVEFDVYVIQTKETTHVRYEHVFSVEVI